MVNHIWTVICSKSAIDKISNNISLFEILEQINIEPATIKEGTNKSLPITFEIVSFWSRDEKDEPVKGKARFVIKGPSGEKHKLPETTVDLTSFQRLRNRMFVNGLPYFGIGFYKFITELYDENKNDWKEVSSQLFPINELNSIKNSNI